MHLMRCIRTLLAVAVVCASGPSLHAATVVCMGDSLTYGSLLGPTYPSPPSAQSYPSQLGLMLPGDTIVNSGVPGSTSSQGWGRWTTDVTTHNPNYVAIMFGTNDSVMNGYNTYAVPVAQFTTNLQNMVTSAKNNNAKPIICGLPPIIANLYFTRHNQAYYDAAGGLNAMLQSYYGAARTVATLNSVPFIPTYDLFGKDMSLIIASDGVHYNADGAYVQASLVHQAIAALNPAGQPAGALYVKTPSGQTTRQLWSIDGGTPHAVVSSTTIAHPSARTGTFNNDLYLVSHGGLNGAFAGVWKFDGTNISEVTSTGDLSGGAPVAFTVYQDNHYQVSALVTNTAWMWNVNVVPEPSTGVMTIFGVAGLTLAGWIRKRFA